MSCASESLADWIFHGKIIVKHLKSWNPQAHNSPPAPPGLGYTPPRVGSPYVTTAQVCAAAGISAPTALRWSKAGLLPPYERVHGGKRGQYARWPAHAPDQARWVKARLGELYSFEEIRSMLERGAFSADPSAEEKG